jgi:hypothetical protein
MNLEIIPQAQRDIAEAAKYYRDRRAGLDVEFLTEVDAAVAEIAGDPLRFAQVRPGIHAASWSDFRTAFITACRKATLYGSRSCVTIAGVLASGCAVSDRCKRSAIVTSAKATRASAHQQPSRSAQKSPASDPACRRRAWPGRRACYRSAI